ncbi:hypothetical protein jhhlp_005639 [Lomentospora prolificans]|uniref:MINDY deubiquitinase domain-containing protein n=1 Tax=Lomentospora prolificans TaxID=41688 RepID=A0A2N3N3Q6_9PEZI|nr:hypothetical protein jhhlp_005639 [Lomentospora prolificans]
MGGERDGGGEASRAFPNDQDRQQLGTGTDPWTGWNNSNPLPNPLASNPPENVPTPLRPGGPTPPGVTEEDGKWDTEPKQPLASADHLNAPPFVPSSSPGIETNPFLKKIAKERTGGSTDSSTPTIAFGQMSLNEPSNNPWDPVPPVIPPANTGSGVDISQRFDSTDDPWAAEPSKSAAEASFSTQPTLTAPDNCQDLLVWADEPARPPKEPIVKPAAIPDQVASEHDAWEDGPRPTPADTDKMPAVPTIKTEEPSEEWDMIFNDTSARGSVQALASEGATPSNEGAVGKAVAQPPQSPAAGSSAFIPPPPPPRITEREATEMYHIKSINWHDHKAQRNPRASPILVQNANGPCPLVALVNALVLTTPASAGDTPIISVLKSREQISISLLLEAVVEELMSSPRRGGGELPDMTDLYSFLKGLDTGMNVNPRFVPSDETAERIKSSYLSHVPAHERDQCIPGVFEATKEMDLYATFAIPLVHGWLPSTGELVYDSLKRRATSYEEAQHLLFMEEELNEKLENPDSAGLTPEEQVLYEDIMIIKTFLNSSATQLTPWGLEVLRKAMAPGMVAILFRNDHFSTLYKHPESLGLLTLVTDAGYSGHQEVVWESLGNINGDVEFYSGDFRLVSGADAERDNAQSPPGPLPSGEGEWTTVRGRGGNRGGSNEPQRSPNIEQEDEDFAMALQLQEEEDERHRQEQQARRNQERRFSERFIEQQGRHRPEPFSSRMSLPTGRTTGLRQPSANSVISASPQVVRPLVPLAGAPAGRPPVHRPTGTSGDDAPPSYDESAHDTPFRPPVGHPSHPSSVPGVPQQQGPYPAPSAAAANVPRPTVPQRRPVPASAIASSSSASGRDRDCVVM